MGRLDSGLYAAHAAATAALASAACESTMAMCVSVSGGVNMTSSFLVSMDHPEGTLKVAPAEVTRGVSAVTRSIAGFVSAACGEEARLEAAKTLKERHVTKAVR